MQGIPQRVEETDLCPILDGAADISCQEDETWETSNERFARFGQCVPELT